MVYQQLGRLRRNEEREADRSKRRTERTAARRTDKALLTNRLESQRARRHRIWQQGGKQEQKPPSEQAPRAEGRTIEANLDRRKEAIDTP